MADAARAAEGRYTHTYLVHTELGHGRQGDGDVVETLSENLVGLIVRPALVAAIEEHEVGLLRVDGKVREVLLVGIARELEAPEVAHVAHVVVPRLGLQFVGIEAETHLCQFVADVFCVCDGLVDWVDDAVDELHDA